MKKITTQVFILYFLLLCNGLQAQLQPVYHFQQDDTVLRKKYYDEAVEAKKQSIDALSKEYNKEYKDLYESRFTEIGEFLESSRAVTEHSANDYLQSVVQKIVDANPELKPLQLRVIFSRDWWPNAYSMGDGTMAVNAGLLIYLSNEAQLVFVLSHELAHFYLDHSGKSFKKYIETVNSASFKDEVKRLSKEGYRINQQVNDLVKSIRFDNLRHSRANEAEADMYGFKFMKNTGYDCNGIITTLQLLDKVDDTLFLPRLDISKTLNLPDYPFRKKWIEKETVLFGELKEDDSPLTKKEKDSLKSHPDCAQRIQLLTDSVRMHPGGKLFLSDEQKFNSLKNDFVAEMSEELYRQKNLGRHLYYSLLKLQNKQDDQLAIYTTARCLNLMVENQKVHKMGTMFEGEDRHLPADYNQLLRMLSRIRLPEMAELAYYFCRQYKDLMKDYPGFDTEIRKAVNAKTDISN